MPAVGSWRLDLRQCLKRDRDARSDQGASGRKLQHNSNTAMKSFKALWKKSSKGEKQPEVRMAGRKLKNALAEEPVLE